MNLESDRYFQYNPLNEYTVINNIWAVRKFQNKIVTYFITDNINKFFENKDYQEKISFALVDKGNMVAIFPLYDCKDGGPLIALNNNFQTNDKKRLYLKKVDPKGSIDDSLAKLLSLIKQNPSLKFATKTNLETIETIEYRLNLSKKR